MHISCTTRCIVASLHNAYGWPFFWTTHEAMPQAIVCNALLLARVRCGKQLIVNYFTNAQLFHNCVCIRILARRMTVCLRRYIDHILFACDDPILIDWYCLFTNELILSCYFLGKKIVFKNKCHPQQSFRCIRFSEQNYSLHVRVLDVQIFQHCFCPIFEQNNNWMLSRQLPLVTFHCNGLHNTHIFLSSSIGYGPQQQITLCQRDEGQ